MAKNLKSELWQGDKDPIQQLAESNSKLGSSMASVEAYAAIVQEIANGLKEISANSKALKESFSGSTGSKLGDQVKVNEAHKDAIRIFKAEQEATKALKDAKDALARAQAAEAKAIRENEKLYENFIKDIDKRAQKEEAAAAKREAQYNKEIAQTAKQNTLYNRTQQKLNGLIFEYKDLAVKKELGIKLTDEEIKRYEFLGKKIGKYDGALKRADASMGKHGREVGNYAKTFDGLGFSVQQLIREAPSLANSFQTFALAISNNIPMFTDEIQKIISANKELAASGKPTTSVFKQIASSIFSVTGIIGLAVTAFTVLAPVIADFFRGSEKTTKQLNAEAKAHKELKKKREEGFKFVGEESKAYIGYILALKKTNQDSKERSRMISEINEKYQVTLKNIKDETLFQAQLNKEIKNYITFQRARYQVDKFQDLISRNLTSQDKLRAETAKRLGISAKLLDTYADNVRKSLNNASESIGDYIKTQEEINQQKFNPTLTESLKQYVNEIDEFNKRLESYGFNILDADSAMAVLGYEIDKTTHKANTQIDMFNKTISETLKLLDGEKELIQEIRELLQDQRIADFQFFSEKELEEQTKSAIETGKFIYDELRKLREDEFKSREEFLKQRSDSDIQSLKDELSTEYQTQLEELKNKRNNLLQQDKLTLDERIQIQKSYLEKLQELNILFDDKSSEEQRLLALQILQINTKLSNDLIQLNRDKNEVIKNDNETLKDAQLEGSLNQIESYYKQQETILNNGKNTSEEISKQLKENRKTQIEEEIAELKKYGIKYKDEIEDRQLELSKLKKDQRDEDLKQEQKYRDELKKLLDKSIDEAIKTAEKLSKFREDKFNDEMNQSKALEDQIIAQSQAGIDTDEQSLAAQKKVTAEKLKLKQAEQKEQEILAKIKAGYEIFQTLLSQGKSVGEATTGTASGLTVIERIIRLFAKPKAFFDGAEDTGSGGGLDGHGGFPAILHPHERVVPRDINEKLKGIPNDHLPDAIKAYDLFRVNGMIKQNEIDRPIIKQDVAHSPILLQQLKKLDVIADKLDNIPNEFFSVEMRGAVLHAFHEQRKANETKRTYLKT